MQKHDIMYILTSSAIPTPPPPKKSQLNKVICFFLGGLENKRDIDDVFCIIYSDTVMGRPFCVTLSSQGPASTYIRACRGRGCYNKPYIHIYTLHIYVCTYTYT